MDNKCTPTAVRERAEQIYQNELHAQIETEDNKGRIVLINTNDGSYAIGDNSLLANKRLREQNADADPEDLFALRIGHPHVYMFDETLLDAKS